MSPTRLCPRFVGAAIVPPVPWRARSQGLQTGHARTAGDQEPPTVGAPSQRRVQIGPHLRTLFEPSRAWIHQKRDLGTYSVGPFFCL
jgi:hypothetical protein